MGNVGLERPGRPSKRSGWCLGLPLSPKNRSRARPRPLGALSDIEDGPQHRAWLGPRLTGASVQVVFGEVQIIYLIHVEGLRGPSCPASVGSAPCCT